MKVHEIENFPESLSILFNHFRKHDIRSSLAPVEDFDALYNIIVNSQYRDYQYIDSINSYSIDFIIDDSSFQNKVYYFLCKNNNEDSSLSLLIDFAGGAGTSFLKFEYSIDPYPPFIKGLMDINDNIMITNLHDGEKIQYVTQSEILTPESFVKIIDDYSTPDKLCIIELD